MRPLAPLTKVGVHQRWPKLLECELFPTLFRIHDTNGLVVLKPKICFTVLGCWEYKNHYRLRNLETPGNPVALVAKEESGLCARACCANARQVAVEVIQL